MFHKVQSYYIIAPVLTNFRPISASKYQLQFFCIPSFMLTLPNQNLYNSKKKKVNTIYCSK